MDGHEKRQIRRARALRAWLLASAMVACLPAQDASSPTRISATATDALFLVDGQVLSRATEFRWPAGSKHTLEVAPWQFAPSSAKTRYSFQHWSTAAGQLASPSNLVTITADPGVPWYNADLTVEYAVSLNYFQCPSAGCASPGTIWVNQVAYQQNTDVWAAAGSSVALEAVPHAGYVFAGWLNGGPSSAFYSLVLNSGITVYPSFAVARAIQLETSPDGLQLLADHAPVTAPVTFEWGLNTIHALGATSPQADRHGRTWMLRSWSDGGAATRNYQVPPGSAPVTLVAQFVPAVAVALMTEPPGLTLTIDNIDGPSPRYLAWAPGEQHTVAAPVRTTDGTGAPWSFRQWSNGGPGSQTIQVSDAQADSGIRLTASYDPLSRIRLDSAPSGLALSVDGAECRTPCEVDRSVGSTVRLAAPPSIVVADGARLDFVSWEGTSGPTLAAAAGYQKIMARYQTSYRLALSMSPAGAGTWRLAPPSADAFYPAGTSVSIAIDPAAGMKFRAWGLDLSGSADPQSLQMDNLHSVLALFDKLPDTPPPPHIANAAGDTPGAGVAPGSVASLFGTGLTDATATAVSDPLPQTLGGVSLFCRGRWLPLLYVSPDQINFQVPGDFQPGSYPLELHRANTPVTQIDLTVIRNAPGLFLAVHRDNSPITADSPAQPGEAVLLYGTGLGPYVPSPMDGFRVPASPTFFLADPLLVLIGNRAVTPDFAGAAVGAVGVSLIEARIPGDLDASAPAAIVIQSGGALSNTLPLVFGAVPEVQ